MTTLSAREPWPELAPAQRLVLLDLLLYGTRSRIRLAERAGMSRASLTRIARELVDLGLIVEGELELTATRGRPAESLHLRPEAAHFLGVKLTGDTLYAVVTDLAAQVIEERAIPLASRDVAAVVALIAEVAAQLLDGRHRPAAIGIGLAGDVRRVDGVSVVERSGFLGWADAVPLAGLVEAAAGLPVVISNDVHALTAAHHWFGSGIGRRSLVVYGLGAGIGSGIVIDDELMEGSHGRSGRIGHTRIGGEGRRCDNGHLDCVHSFVTIPSIEHNAGTGPGSYPQLVARATADDQAVLAVFGRAAYALGAVIADSVNAFDPELVSVMGEGVDMLELAPEQVQRGLAEFLEQVPAESVVIEHPPFDFGLYARGAAITAMRELFS